MRVPETQYARTDDGVFLAYQALGDGPAAFVGAPPIVSNIEVIWEQPEAATFLERLASFCRFVHYDKRGQGMSDRVDETPTLERRARDMCAVMDAAGLERAVVGGISEGGTTAAMVAATYPDRVAGLALFGAFARLRDGDDYPGLSDELLEAFSEAWAASWGSPETMTVAVVTPDRVGDARFVEFINRFERQSSTPRGLLAQLEWARQLDVRALLPVIDVPTLVMHRVGDHLIPVEHGRWIAKHIRNAKLVELEGNEHVPYFGDYDLILDEIEHLVTGGHRSERVDRVLATVVFTDIVASTERAAGVGDREWHRVLDRHDEMAGRIVARHYGRIVNTTGDGVLARFDGPARGLHCATELVHAAEQLGLGLRAGVHTGEVEIRGDDIAGIAVHIGARVAALAGAGEVFASRTVKDLVAGSGISFDDRGVHILKGVPDEWQVFAVSEG